MIKKYLCVLALANLTVASAQDGTSSPYSYYGFGEQRFKGVNEIKDMGGLAVYNDSLRLNTLNPASYGELKNATFSLGASYRDNTLKSNTQKAKTTTGSFDYFALSIPVGKIGIGLGIMPSHFTGYKTSSFTKESGMDVNSLHTGDGGINRTFLGIGYKINKQFSIGAEVAYLFGDITNEVTKVVLDNGDGLALDRGTLGLQTNEYSGFDLNFAVNFKQPISEKLFVNFTGTFSPEMTMDNNQKYTLSSVRISDNSFTPIETLEVNNSKRELKNPMKYSFGAGIGDPFKWFIGAEYTATQSSVYNDNWNYNNASFNDASKIAIGGFYTPKYNSYTSYLQRTTYRAGLRYEDTGLEIANESIKDLGAHIGFGFPVGRNNSNLNIGLEYGKRGTKNNGLIQENYFTLSVGFSFNDRWFEKRRFE